MMRTLLIILIIVLLGAGGYGAYYFLTQPKQETSQTETKPKTTSEQPKTHTYTSPKGVAIELDNWYTNTQVSSPLTISGKVPGNWSFEASFPVKLKDASGKVIAQAPAHLEGEWMTDKMVVFNVTLTFEKPTGTNMSGTLVLQKDNPSGLAANEDSVEVPVTFK